jgi:hypothetical protein
MRQYERDPQTFERALAEMEIPDSIPAVGKMTFGPDGEIWVARLSVMPEDPRIWDIFNGAGEYLGEVTGPPNFFIMSVGSDYVLGQRRDDLDVPFVELHRLIRTGGR